MFVESRDQSRQFFLTVWQKLAPGEALGPLEAVVAGVIRAHPEYHQVLAQGEAALARTFGPGETNPFLHMGLHVALIEQLQSDRPAGIVGLYRQLVLQHAADIHGLEHRIIDCLAAVLWAAGNSGERPDEQDFLTRVGRLLG